MNFQLSISKFKVKIAIFFFVLFSLFTINYSLVTAPVSAHCPLCVAGAAVGVSLARYFGVDDTITGIWIGALLGAMSFWFLNWLMTRDGPLQKYRVILKPGIYGLIWGSTLWSFYKFQLIIRMTQIFGFDKLTFGMIVGGIAFYVIDSVRIKHYFNYQKIVISLGSVTILSLLMYILINFFV